jgi:protein-tyrosine-phosphatase
MLPTVVRAARDLSLSLEDHRSQLLDPATVDPDLVLTMTEDQRRELVRRRPQTLHHTFTVREAVRLLDSSRWDPRWEGTSELVEQLHRLRPLVPAARGPEDVPDPVNGGRRLAAAVVAELQRYAPRLAQALWGPVPRGGTGPEAQTSTAGR